MEPEEEEDEEDDAAEEIHSFRISSHRCNPVFTNFSGGGGGDCFCSSWSEDEETSAAAASSASSAFSTTRCLVDNSFIAAFMFEYRLDFMRGQFLLDAKVDARMK